MWGHSLIPSAEILSIREFERNPAPVTEVEERRLPDGRLLEVVVTYRRAKGARDDESAPVFGLCEHKGRWLLCYPPDDT